MTNASINEETRSLVLAQLSATLEKQVAEQVAEILRAAEADTAQVLAEEEEAANTPSLGFSVPMPGVRYYTYL